MNALELKSQLQSQLDHPIVPRQQSAVAADVLGDVPEVRGVKVDTAICAKRPIHMVGEVESFPSQLNRSLSPSEKVRDRAMFN